MIHDYDAVVARTREVVAGHEDLMYDPEPAPGAIVGDEANPAKCRYYEPVGHLDGLPMPDDLDDEDLIGLIIDDPDRVTFSRGAPSCLIGQVLDPWLDDDQRDYVWRIYNTETITNGLYGYLVDERVLVKDTAIAAWLRAAQEAQDRGEPWGQCLHQAQEFINSAVTQTMTDMEHRIADLNAGLT